MGLHEDDRGEEAEVDFAGEGTFEAGTLFWGEITHKLRGLAFGAGFGGGGFEGGIRDMFSAVFFHCGVEDVSGHCCGG